MNTFYNLVTDFYEWGWGTSFHFSPQLPGKTQCVPHSGSAASTVERRMYQARFGPRLDATPCHMRACRH